MLVSEQASEKVELADYLPGASTFPGHKTSGGWIPILLKVDDFSRPIILDWLCPSCQRLLAGSRSCPHCGLELKASPKTKDPLPKRMKILHFRVWADEIFETGYDPRGTEAVRKAPPSGGTRKTFGLHRVRHKAPESAGNNE